MSACQALLEALGSRNECKDRVRTARELVDRQVGHAVVLLRPSKIIG